MDVLPSSFRALNRLGLWKDGAAGNETLLRVIFRVAIIVVLLYVTVTEIIEVFYLDVEELIPNFFLLMCYIGLVVKMLNFYYRHDEVDKLLERFRSNLCQPQTIIEKRILNKYQNTAAFLYSFFLSFGLLCSIIISIWPLYNLLRHAKVSLIIKAYSPYDTSKPLNFWLTFVFQFFLEPFAGCLNVIFDAMIYGFILIATGQFELCYYRLQSCINDGSFASFVSKQKWIDHHVLAINIIRDIQNIFMGVVVPFLFSSLIMLCAVVFKMNEEKLFSIDFFVHVLYYMLIIVETVLYCWSGNELIIKYNDIANAAYNSEWMALEPRDRKYLLFILRIGQKATTISFKGQGSLSMQTFMWIIKTSYGAFNVLKGASGV